MLFASNSQYNLSIKIVPHTRDDRHDPALSVVIVLNTAMWVKYCGCVGIYCLRRTAFSLIGTSGSILKFLASFTGRGCKRREMKNIETHCTCLPAYLYILSLSINLWGDSCDIVCITGLLVGRTWKALIFQIWVQPEAQLTYRGIITGL